MPARHREHRRVAHAVTVDGRAEREGEQAVLGGAADEAVRAGFGLSSSQASERELFAVLSVARESLDNYLGKNVRSSLQHSSTVRFSTRRRDNLGRSQCTECLFGAL